MRLDGVMSEQEKNIVLVGEDGSQVVIPNEAPEERSPTEFVEQPAKVMRIGPMVKQLLEEVGMQRRSARVPRIPSLQFSASACVRRPCAHRPGPGDRSHAATG